MSDKRLLNNILTIVFIIMVILFTISYAILIPISFRPFYYLSIKIFKIEESSGYSYEEIREAFDDMMDFLWLGKEFKTGSLEYTEEGMNHFKDCIPLFRLDLAVFIVSTVYIISHFILVKFKILEFKRFKNFSPLFFVGISTILVITILGILISIDFDKAFAIFHKMFFPGKDNWLFDPDEDEIINILPAEFFALCAGWIFGHILIFDISFITYGIINKRNQKLNNIE